MTELAGNEELQKKVSRVLTTWRRHDLTEGVYYPLDEIMNLITASNQQLLRELEGQAVDYGEDVGVAGYPEMKWTKAVPLSIIQDKLKTYGEK